MTTSEANRAHGASDGAATSGAILFITSFAHAMSHVYVLLFTGIVEPMRESFGLAEDDLFAYAAIGSVTFGLGAVPAGWLGDRIGEKRMLVAFFVVTAIGGALVGAASGIWLLAAGMLLVGIGTSIYHPVGLALISKVYPSPAKALGVNGVFGSIGTAAGPFIAVQAAEVHRFAPIAEADSWRVAYVGLALPMLAIGLWLARVRLPAEVDEDEPAAIGAPPPEPGAPRARRARVLSSPLVLLLLAMTCGGFYFNLVTSILPTRFGDAVDFGDADRQLAAGNLAAVVLLVGGVGQVLSGYLAHRFEGRGVYVLVLAIAAPLLFLVGRTDGVPLVAVAALMAIFLFAVQPIENTLVSKLSPRRARGLLFGTKFILVFGVGGLGTYLSGAVDASSGSGVVFTVASGFTAVALVFAVLAWRAR